MAAENSIQPTQPSASSILVDPMHNTDPLPLTNPQPSQLSLPTSSGILSGITNKILATPSTPPSVVKNIAQLTKIANEQVFGASIMARGLLQAGFKNFATADALEGWNQNYPYRLLVLSVDNSGTYTQVAEFRLPINPQELTVT